MPTVDLVWVVGGEPDYPGRDEMRYSCRSFAENLQMPIRDAWAIGDPPEWFAGARLPLEPHPSKMTNQFQSLKAYANLPGAADHMVVLNDDMYLLQPTDHIPIYRNKSRASAWARAEEADGVTLNNWHKAVRATASWVAELTETDPYIYECHVPLVFSTRRLAELLNAYPIGQPFAVGELFPIAGIGGDGTHAGNAKAKSGDNLEHKLNLPMEFVSGNPDSWNGKLGAYIRATFPDKCRFER